MPYNLIAVDLDGTIIEYSGWKGVGVFGPVLPGAREALRQFWRMGKRIIINTSRGEKDLVEKFLLRERIPFDFINQNPPDAPKNLSTAKVIADIYIDDRAIGFRGDWAEVVRKVERYQHWYEKGKPAKVPDIREYNKEAASIGGSLSGFQSYFEDIFRLAGDIISCDVFTRINTSVWRYSIRWFIGMAPKEFAKEARAIFVEKNSERGGLWREVGVCGAASEIHGKLTRLRVNPADHDAIVDLMNYLIIAAMCLNPRQLCLRPVRVKNAVVTGTENPSGLGAIIKEVLEMNGYKVWEINFQGAYSVKAIKDRVREGLRKVECKRHQDIELVVNNYGINKLAWLGSFQDEDFSVIDANLKTPFIVVDELVRRACPDEHRPCRIVNVASQTYRIPQRCTSAYSASKAGLAQATKVMARELAPKGFVVNAIAPGAIEDTTMHRKVMADLKRLRGWKLPKAKEIMVGNIPAGRFTNRLEVAVAILQIARLPRYVNGAVIEMTGGQ